MSKSQFALGAPLTSTERPRCTACGSMMKLVAIEPSDAENDLRTFACPACKRGQPHILECAEAEASPEPHDVVGARHGSAVTYEIHEGRMIPKPAK